MNKKIAYGTSQDDSSHLNKFKFLMNAITISSYFLIHIKEKGWCKLFQIQRNN